MKIIACYAIFCFALFASCALDADPPPVSGEDNPEILPGGEEPSKHPEMGSISITVINPDGYLAPAQRTLYPGAPQFSRYAISFLPLDNQGTEKEDEFLEDTGRKFNLEAGRWGIIVQGFNENDKAIAQGGKEITVVPETDIAEEIQLESVPPDGRDGVFVWSISIKPGVSVDSWSLTLSQWDNEQNISLAFPEPGDSGISAGVPSVEISRAVPSGFYVMRVSFSSDGRAFTFNEIVHIYPDQTTTFNYQVTETEFLPALTLSGILQATATFNGYPEPALRRRVWLYNERDERIAFADVNGSGAWAMAVVKPLSPLTVHFTAELEIVGHIREVSVSGVMETIQDNDISGIALSIHFPGILLEGTVSLFKDESLNINEDGWEVSAYTDPDNPRSSALTLAPANTDRDGIWDMLVSAFDGPQPQDVYFSIERIDPYNNRIYRRENLGATQVYDQPVSGIILNGNFKTPARVEIHGNLPSLNDWSDPKVLNHQDQKTCFVYSQQNLGNGARYEITFAVHWDNPEIDDIEYAFDTIVGTPPSYLSSYRKGSSRDGISWLHYTANAVRIKNLLFTLDFSNNEYFETGMPSLSIEKRDETAVPINSKDLTSGEHYFYMGSPNTEAGRNGPGGMSSETQHYVKFTKNLWVTETEVTQSVYEELMPAPPYTGLRGADYPAVDIAWLDAVKFANRLSEKYGLKPVYTIPENAGSSGIGVTADWNAGGWRLPTESEWEFIARAGTTTTFSTGGAISTALANFNNAIGRICDVRSYAANDFGLYGMHGNAWEFCWDWYGDYPAGTQASPVSDPRGHADGNNGPYGPGDNYQHHAGNPPPGCQRIIRGGGYYNSDRFLRSAHRGVMDAERSNDIGFRLVRIAD